MIPTIDDSYAAEPTPPDLGPLIDGERFCVRGGQFYERIAGNWVVAFDVPAADIAPAPSADELVERAEGAATDAAPAEPIAAADNGAAEDATPADGDVPRSRVVDFDQLRPALDLGLDVIPLKRWDMRDQDGKEAGKAPRDNRWVIQEYTLPEVLKWVDEGGNVGVRLRPTELVIDVDPKHKDAEGLSAQALLDDLELELGIDLSTAPTVVTGSGGFHVYLKIPADTRVRNSTEPFGGAIEYKSYGRQVVAPGSKHPNGEYYKWLRNEAGPVPIAPESLIKMIAKPPLSKRERKPGEEVSIEIIERCLEQLDPTEFQDYEKWRDLMFSVHCASNGSEEGREVFIKWSTGDPKHAGARGSIETFWEYATDNRSDARTEKTLFWLVQEGGGKVPLDVDKEFPDDVEILPAALTEQRQALLDMKTALAASLMLERKKNGEPKHTFANALAGIRAAKFEPALNELTDKVELRAKELPFDHPIGSVVTDDVVHVIREWLILQYRLEVTPEHVHNALRTVGLERRFNPVVDHLDSLKWDRARRLETWLINCSDLDDTPYNRAVSRLLLLGAVARAYVPGIKFDSMPILEGPQGGWKSTLIKHLGGEWYAAGMPPLTSGADKEVCGHIQGKWLIEIEELAATKKTEADALKSFLSRTEDRMRKPYGREWGDYPRRCVFIGTTNDAHYLRDSTGARRFLPVTVGTIDLTAVKRDRDQLWAEAVAAWKADPRAEALELPSALWSEAALEQEGRRVRDAWEDLLREKLGAPDDPERCDGKIRSEDVWYLVGREDAGKRAPADNARLGAVMRTLGFKPHPFKVDGRKTNGYVRLPAGWTKGEELKRMLVERDGRSPSNATVRYETAEDRQARADVKAAADVEARGQTKH